MKQPRMMASNLRCNRTKRTKEALDMPTLSSHRSGNNQGGLPGRRPSPGPQAAPSSCLSGQLSLLSTSHVAMASSFSGMPILTLPASIPLSFVTSMCSRYPHAFFHLRLHYRSAAADLADDGNLLAVSVLVRPKSGFPCGTHP